MHEPGIYPPTLPNEILNDPRREAERVVFGKLASHLEDFTVFYNCTWLDDSKGSSLADGEADFVVAHPHWGFIVLEVKGGIVSRDPDTRKWKSKNRHGKVFIIQNPIEQAVKSKHVILEKIRKSWPGKPPFIRAKHGVVFPDSGRPKNNKALGADMPLDIFAFAEDVEILGKKVVQILMHEPDGSETRYGHLGQQGIEILHDLFNRGFELNVSLSSELAADERRIEELTEQQKEFLDLTAYQNRVVVKGGAGTGKTMLALEKAKRLASDGKKVLVLCFNSPLAAYLQRSLSEFEDASAAPFHQFCLKAARDAGVEIPKAADKDGEKSFFEETLPSILLDALSSNEDLRFDAIIVDEGQDFPTPWWEPIQLALKEGDGGLLYVFMDDNQTIYKDRAGDIPGVSVEPLRLHTNLRNTKKIFSASKAFYSGGPLKGAGPDGKDIEWLSSPPEREARTVERAINKLVNIEGIPKKQISVLTSCALDKSVFEGNDAIGSYETKKADDLDGDAVTLDSVYRYKGLENSVVILTDVDKALDLKEVLYVGFSRAKVLLLVAATPPTIDKLKKMLKAAADVLTDD